MGDRFKTSDGIRLAYYVDDFTRPWVKAPTLVMLHSAMGHSGRYFAMVPRLALDFRVVRLDLRGHGASEVPPPDMPLTMDRLVDDVVELMDEIACPTASFIGNSAGGYVAQNLAMRLPERVEALCLFGSTPGLKETNAGSWLPRIAKEGLRPFLAETISYRFDVERTDPGLIEWFLDEAAKNDVAYLARFVGLMASLDWSGELHRIACPTLLVIPGAETEKGVRNYGAMLDRIPDVTARHIEGAAHNICDAIPERCAEEALAFLRARVLRADRTLTAGAA